MTSRTSTGQRYMSWGGRLGGQYRPPDFFFTYGTWTWWFPKRNLLFQAFRGVHCSGSMLVLLGCNKKQPLRLRLRHDHFSSRVWALGNVTMLVRPKWWKSFPGLVWNKGLNIAVKHEPFPTTSCLCPKKCSAFPKKQPEGLNQRCVDQFKKYTLYPPHFWNTFVGFERNVSGLSHRCLLLIGLVGFPQVPPKNPIGAWSRLPKI